jgi:hypothetical protein
MKKIFYLPVFVAFILLSCCNGQEVVAQTSPELFSADDYEQAIAEIAARSNGRLDENRILEILANDGASIYNPEQWRGDTIYMIPEIKLASYDATSTIFQYVISENFLQDSLKVSFPGNPSWITNSQIDTVNKSVTVTFLANPTFTPRTGEVKISAISGGVTLSFSSFILQQPKPVQLILLTPDLKIVPCEGEIFNVDVFRYNVDGIKVLSKTDPGITVVVSDNYDTLHVTVPSNTLTVMVVDTVVICSVQNNEINDTLFIFRKPCSGAYILLSPRMQFVAWDATQLPSPFNITTQNTGILTATSASIWVIPQIIGNTVQAAMFLNTSAASREAFIVVKDPVAGVSDSVKVVQAGVSAYVLLTPEFSTIGYAGGFTEVFSINSANVPVWNVEFIDPANWIGNTIINGDELAFEVAPNTTSSQRQMAFRVFDAANPTTIADTGILFQSGAPVSALMAAPRLISVGYEGSPQIDYQITALNISGWHVETGSLAPWVVVTNEGGQTLSLQIAANQNNQTRQAQVALVADNNPAIADTVTVLQYAANDSYLLAAPRQQKVGSTGSDAVEFVINAINTGGWNIDEGMLPNWIQKQQATDTLLTLKVLANSDSITRQAQIKIFGNNNPLVYDSVMVYQYSALDTFLLASPREQLVSAAGDDSLTFDVIAVNVSLWEVDANALSSWITPLVFGYDSLTVEIAPNSTNLSRQALVYLRKADNSAIYDSVFIFQYALPDTFLIAAPREQRIGFSGAASVDFTITRRNVSNWQVDLATTPDWLTVTVFGGDDLQFSVDANAVNQTRAAFVRIFATGHPLIDDTVRLYQYSALDTFLLAAPREQVVPFTGSDSINFVVQAVNTGSWQADAATIPAWIQQDVLNDTLISFDVSPNVNDTTRQATIWLLDPGNPAVKDSIQVFQRAAPVATLLAAPREIVVVHTGNPAVNFVVTTANLPNGWEVKTQSVPAEWITVTEAGGEMLTLAVSANTTLESRSATIILQAVGMPQVSDSVMIFQYAGQDRYLLAAPREQRVSHEVNPGVLFTVTAVNTGLWQVIQASVPPDWITITEQGGGLLALDVAQNTEFTSREATIQLAAVDYPNITDSVSVFQYSALASYILGAPHEQEISLYGGDLMPFTITTANVDAWDFTAPATWMMVERFGDQLKVHVDTNNQLDSRYGVIKIFSVSDTTVSDEVSVFQASASQPYLAVMPAGLTSIAADGAQVELAIFSNLLNYSIEKVPGRQWYQLSDTIASGNDTILLTINENQSSFLSRSSYLTFRSTDGVAQQYFYFQQKKNSANFINISGKVLINGETGTPAGGVTVYIGEDSVYTHGENGGWYSYEAPYGWVGAITPRKANFYFEPASFTFEIEQTDSVHADFTAVPIDPKIIFTNILDTLAMCADDVLAPDDARYPLVSISGTYGQRGFRWLSQPFDPNLSADSTSVVTQPVFSPLVTTTYALVMYNYGTTDTAFFTLKLNPLPPAHDFDGMIQVCSRQAGVIYSVIGAVPGETFRWQLTPEAAGTLTPVLDGSVVLIDWGDQPGDVTLSVATISRYGCEQAPVFKTISISDHQAPEKVIITKKTGDNMLLCSTTDADRYEWGWYPINNGYLGERYIIPQKGDWYCRLPHPFDPALYKYFVITWDDAAACGSLSFFNPPVSIGDDPTTKPFRIFPNPAHDQLFIKIDPAQSSEVSTFEIVNLSGQKVMQSEVNDLSGGIFTFEIGRLQPGVYIVRIRIGQRYYHEKIIIQ